MSNANNRSHEGTSGVLHRAADLIERHGWTQGKYTDADSGALCVAGAIRTAVYGSVFRDAVTFDLLSENAAIVALHNHLRLGGADDVTYWNDRAGRTVDDVIGALRASADA